MPDTKVNRTYKDTVFRVIFGEYREHALALYNAINKTDYTDVDELKIITLEDALYIGVKNDVGYIFHDVMALIEQQATFSPNMPLRGLDYFASSLKEYISEKYDKPSILYTERLVRIPTPRYYVLYNGREDQPEEQELRLSDAYDGEGDVEVIVHMLNINIGHNDSLLNACEPLHGYSELVSRIRANKAKGMTDREAVDKAVDSCISDGILVDVLKKERDKVASILLRGLTEEEKKEVERINREYHIELATKEGLEKGMAEGLEKGMAEGLEKGMAKGLEKGMAEGLEQGLKQGLEQGLEQGLKQGLKQGREEAKYEAVDRLVAAEDYDAKRACEILEVSFDDYMQYKKKEH